MLYNKDPKWWAQTEICFFNKALYLLITLCIFVSRPEWENPNAMSHHSGAVFVWIVQPNCWPDDFPVTEQAVRCVTCRGVDFMFYIKPLFKYWIHQRNNKLELEKYFSSEIVTAYNLNTILSSWGGHIYSCSNQYD